VLHKISLKAFAETQARMDVLKCWGIVKNKVRIVVSGDIDGRLSGGCLQARLRHANPSRRRRSQDRLRQGKDIGWRIGTFGTVGRDAEQSSTPVTTECIRQHFFHTDKLVPSAGGEECLCHERLRPRETPGDGGHDRVALLVRIDRTCQGWIKVVVKEGRCVGVNGGLWRG